MSEFLKQLPRPEVHPLLPWLTEAELLALLDRPQGMDLFRAACAKYTGRDLSGMKCPVVPYSETVKWHQDFCVPMRCEGGCTTYLLPVPV